MRMWLFAFAVALGLAPLSGLAGDQAPLAFADEQGAERTLADYRGRVVVLNVWATWCAPCVEEMPALDRLQAAMDPARLTVLPVSVDRDGAAAARAFFEKHGIARLPVLSAKASMAFKAVGESRLPLTVVFDAEGRELERHLGRKAWDSPASIDHLKGFLPAS